MSFNCQRPFVFSGLQHSVPAAGFPPFPSFVVAPTPTPARSVVAQPPSIEDFTFYDANRCALELQALEAKQLSRRREDVAKILRHRQLVKQQLERKAAEEEVLARRQKAFENKIKEALRQQAELQEREQEQKEQRYLDVDPLQFFFGIPSRSHQHQNCHHDSAPAPTPTTTTSVPLPLPTPTPVVESSPVPVESAAAEPSQPVVELSPSAANAAAENEFEAAATLQRHFRSHLARRQNLATLTSLATSLYEHQTSFVAPPSLAFAPSPPSSTVDLLSTDTTAPSTASEPKLAYSSINAPLLAYEDFLVSLLSKIDGVATNQDKIVRRARKELVKRVERELDQLDEIKVQKWNEQQAKVEVQEQPTGTFVLRASAPAFSPSETNFAPSHAASDASRIPSEEVDVALASTEATPLPSSSATTSLPFPTPTQGRPRRHTISSISSSSSSSSGDEDDAHSDSGLDQDVQAMVDSVLKSAHQLGEEIAALEQQDRGQKQPLESEFVLV